MEIAQSVNTSVNVLQTSETSINFLDLNPSQSSLANSLGSESSGLSSTYQLDYVDSIYNVTPAQANGKSYVVDKMLITRENLSSVKINNLSEFMRSEILQYRIGT